ncbi:serine ase inhibitor [Paramuricea clavata]|uniref:Serine ase inhibitor n=1 Tax=Paramuricea clavata TaxID=317549 RepID=A0A7D9HRR4_PARCT|nr:serine ase inhibitor [Paramuricea clavata]
MNACLIFILIVQSLFASSSTSTILQPKHCSLKKVTGPCRAYMPMYYYNQSQGKCIQFIYGGCGGNANRFNTLEDCEKQCDREKTCVRPCPLIYRPICGSDGKTYSSNCEFEVADCLSNGRIKKVHDGACSVCSLDKDPGFCRGYFPRYFYSSKSQACEKFIYGGCQGNQNNFVTLQACQDKCL